MQRKIRFRLLILFLLATGLYLGSLGNGFLWDDDRIIRNNDSIRHPQTAIRWGAGIQGQRPVTNLSFAFDYALWGLWPVGYHLTQILLHGLNTLLVFLLARVVLGSPVGAWGAGLLFAGHPIHTEAVVAFLGRSDLLMTAFFLGAFLLYRRATLASGFPRLLLYGVTALLYLLSLLSKEMGIILPACLLLYELLISLREEGLSRRPGQALLPKASGDIPVQGVWIAWWRARWPFFLVALLAAAAYLVSWLHLGGWQPLTRPQFWGGSLYRTALAMFLVLKEYVRLLLFPLRLCCWYKAPIPDSPWDPAVLLSAALLLGMVGAAGYLSRRSPPLALGIGWFLVTLLPVSNLLPITGSMMAERWLYLPSVGFCLFLGGLMEAGSRLEARGPKHPATRPERVAKAGNLLLSERGRVVLLVILLGLYAVRVVTRTPVWRDSRTLFQQARVDCPPSELIHNNLGEIYQKEGRGELAWQEYQQALALNPNAVEARLNLAALSLERGDADGAIARLEPLMRWERSMAQPYCLLARAYARKGAYARAEECYRIALQLNPTLVEAHYELGNLYQEMGRLDQAERQWREALVLQPDLAPAHNQLGNISLLRGRLEQAVEAYQRALQLDPNNLESHYNLALALERLGRWAEARRHYQSFLALAPAEYAGQKALIRQKLAGRP